jgi:hypothetical protein
MGMSASQARYLSVIARQSDLEYQGQQINQERTVLSQQVSDLYNQLQNMTVPTPPSTTDYTTVQYSGSIGATSYTFDASSVKPSGSDRYIVTVYQDAYGDSVKQNNGYAKVAESNKTVNVTEVETTDNTDKINDPSEYYVSDGGALEPLEGSNLASCVYNYNLQLNNKFYSDSTTEGNIISSSSDNIPYPSTSIEVYAYLVTLNPGVMLYKVSDNGEQMNVKTASAGYTVNGHDVYDINNAGLELDDVTRYTDAIENSGLKDSNGKAYTIDDFYFYFNDKGVANFVLRSDVQDKNDTAITYSYIANGNYKKSIEYEDCTLEFDPSNGRITNLGIPNGNLGWTSIDVEATTVTDDTAYQEAYNKYEYNKYLYDKEQQDINAKTEVIQQEDKRLELKLTRLDNERTQITTEVEALDKVINDNIEASYKTFSG